MLLRNLTLFSICWNVLTHWMTNFALSWVYYLFFTIYMQNVKTEEDCKELPRLFRHWFFQHWEVHWCDLGMNNEYRISLDCETKSVIWSGDRLPSEEMSTGCVRSPPETTEHRLQGQEAHCMSMRDGWEREREWKSVSSSHQHTPQSFIYMYIFVSHHQW